MALVKHLINGGISTLISVAVTYAMADDGDGPWELDEMVLSVAISSFLSGFFTSYFAES
jgi:hypothetical protein